MKHGHDQGCKISKIYPNDLLIHNMKKKKHKWNKFLKNNGARKCIILIFIREFSLDLIS
jgi:hypothetical protein